VGGIGQIDCAVDLNQLFELLRGAEPLDAALKVTADRVTEMLLRDFFAALLVPLRKAQFQIDVDDALAAARNLIEQPAESVAEAGDETIRQ